MPVHSVTITWPKLVDKFINLQYIWHYEMQIILLEREKKKKKKKSEWMNKWTNEWQNYGAWGWA